MTGWVWGFVFVAIAVVGLLLYAGYIAGRSDSRAFYQKGLNDGIEIGKQYPDPAVWVKRDDVGR